MLKVESENNESVWLLKIEGVNRVYICRAVKDIAKFFGVSNKTALKFFSKAVLYSNPMTAILNQISYLLEMFNFKRLIILHVGIWYSLNLPK